MDLVDEFEVTLPLEDAWTVLTDLERVAPCLPGAQLDEVDGEEYRGRVRIKVGPITVEYKGAARFTEVDANQHIAALHAQGRESRGQGAASADIRATLTEAAPGRTKVVVATSLDVSGKVAQLGRGALADVSARLMRQFVENLERDLTAAAEAVTAPAAAQTETNGTAPTLEPNGSVVARTTPTAPTAAPLSATRLIGPVIIKRVLPPAILAVVAVLLRRLRSRSRS